MVNHWVCIHSSLQSYMNDDMHQLSSMHEVTIPHHETNNDWTIIWDDDDDDDDDECKFIQIHFIMYRR